MEFKIFNISAHKTGTTSLEKLFLNNFDDCLFPTCGDEKFDKNEDFVEYIINCLESKYIYFSDSPFNHKDNYKVIYDTFKNENIKFILTIRDTNCWEKSVKKWIKKMNNEEVYEELYNFKLSQTYNENVKYYEERNNEIINFFIKNNCSKNLLVLNLEDGNLNIQKIENFLNVKLKEKELPHININS